MMLFHGSDVAIERPVVAYNTGFADLGQGFYLTSDRDAACSRARTRARGTAVGEGVVSSFSFSEGSLPWVTLGEDANEAPAGVFGLRFAPTPAGVAAWMNYICACRQGATAVPGVGEPSVVRAWIATEEVEMVVSGFASAEELAEFVDPAELVVQYCFRTQSAIDGLLVFEGSFPATEPGNGGVPTSRTIRETRNAKCGNTVP